MSLTLKEKFLLQARVKKIIRQFFETKNFTEITPQVLHTAVPEEPTIVPFQTGRWSCWLGSLHIRYDSVAGSARAPDFSRQAGPRTGALLGSLATHRWPNMDITLESDDRCGAVRPIG